MSDVRVRFAPSPTGPLHIGGVRTALFNYLFAKKNSGTFILRIEDTDQNRFVPGAEDYIVEALNWCGIPYDEGPDKNGGFGPYRQSERKHLYGAYAQKLVLSGDAYYAFDTTEALDSHRQNHEAKGKTFIYNWHNRLKLDNSLCLSQDEVQSRINSGEDYVVRFKVPQDKTLVLHDVIRGKINIDTNTLDDKILFKSDGMPTYHLANIVDDHLMEISHVIRGEEWLPSLALHQLLYDAFGWNAPQFAHLPLIMKPIGKGKLSKRDGEKGGFPVFPLQWNDAIGYRETGFFPEAVINFLALLGWNPGTEQEIFSLSELVEAFTLERVNKSGARFDPEKTKWYNHQYLQRKPLEEITSIFIQEQGGNYPQINQKGKLYTQKAIALVKKRAHFTAELWELVSYFFVAPAQYNEKAIRKQFKEDTLQNLKDVHHLLEPLSTFTSKKVEDEVKTWINQNERSFGKVMGPLRLSLVGDLKGPHLFDIIEMIGKEETLLRIQNTLEQYQ